MKCAGLIIPRIGCSRPCADLDEGVRDHSSPRRVRSDTLDACAARRNTHVPFARSMRVRRWVGCTMRLGRTALSTRSITSPPAPNSTYARAAMASSLWARPTKLRGPKIRSGAHSTGRIPAGTGTRRAGGIAGGAEFSEYGDDDGCLVRTEVPVVVEPTSSFAEVRCLRLLGHFQWPLEPRPHRPPPRQRWRRG